MMLTEIREKYLNEQITRLKGKLDDADRYDKNKDGYGAGKLTNEPDKKRGDGLQDVRNAIKMYEDELKAG